MANSKPFTPFAENMYVANVSEIEITQEQGTDWSGGMPVKTDEMVDQVRVTFILEKPVDGETLYNVDGEEAEYNSTRFWFDPIRTGHSARGPSKARQFLCAAMGWDTDVDIDLAVLEDLIVNKKLLGKQLKLYISLFVRKDGTKGNKIERFVSIVEPKPGAEAAPGSAPEAAANVPEPTMGVAPSAPEVAKDAPEEAKKA